MTQAEKYRDSVEYRETMKAKSRLYHNTHKDSIKIKRAAYFAEYRRKNKDRLKLQQHQYKTLPRLTLENVNTVNQNKESTSICTRRCYLKRKFGISLEQMI